jgi:hypothetical protein
MRKPLQIGDLVWYNVGGQGYETMGLIIETADLWKDRTVWNDQVRKYANCVRIKWMRVGKLKPRAINMPLYRQVIKARWDIENIPSGFAEWERDSILTNMSTNSTSMGSIETGEWYEGHFFKALGAVQARRK